MAEVKLAAMYGRKDIPEIKACFRKHASEMTLSFKVINWCEDSFILLDLMCELISENKTLMRSEGMRHFYTFNYNLASKIKSPINRFISYLIVFKKFGYLYSMRRIFYSSIFFRQICRIKRKMNQVLNSIVGSPL